MLRRTVGTEIWCVSQPDHAAVSGYLAQHWGNGDFSGPGYYAPYPEPERLRAETVLAIAEHDNGWREWEANPQLDPASGLPLDLSQMSQADGLERWRLGVPRMRESHPYAALLISSHAYWLHAPRVGMESDTTFFHPLFGNPDVWPGTTDEERRQARDFAGEQHILQELLIDRIRRQSPWEQAVESWHLRPHTRLLQVADALSLHLCFGGADARAMPDIPRKNWSDRVTLQVRPAGDRRVAIDPYPFDQDPLPVELLARVLQPGARPRGDFPSWWRALPVENLKFSFSSQRAYGSPS